MPPGGGPAEQGLSTAQQIAEGEPLPPGGLVHRLCRGAGGAEHRVPLLGGEGVGAEVGLLGQLPGPGGRLCSPAGQPLKIEIGRDGRPVGVFILETPLPADGRPQNFLGEASASRRAARRAGSRRRGSFGPSFGRAADGVGVGVGAAESRARLAWGVGVGEGVASGSSAPLWAGVLPA